jgi:hypothetical protein
MPVSDAVEVAFASESTRSATPTDGTDGLSENGRFQTRSR